MILVPLMGLNHMSEFWTVGPKSNNNKNIYILELIKTTTKNYNKLLNGRFWFRFSSDFAPVPPSAVLQIKKKIIVLLRLILDVSMLAWLQWNDKRPVNPDATVESLSISCMYTDQLGWNGNRCSAHALHQSPTRKGISLSNGKGLSWRMYLLAILNQGAIAQAETAQC